MISVNVADTHAHNRSSPTRCHPTRKPSRPRRQHALISPRSVLGHVPVRHSPSHSVTHTEPSTCQPPTPPHSTSSCFFHSRTTYQNKYKRSHRSHSRKMKCPPLVVFLLLSVDQSRGCVRAGARMRSKMRKHNSRVLRATSPQDSARGNMSCGVLPLSVWLSPWCRSPPDKPRAQRQQGFCRSGWCLELRTKRRPAVLRKLGRQQARKSVWHVSVSLVGSAVSLTCWFVRLSHG